MDEKIIKEIQSLKHEQVYIIPESDYGKAEIRYINEVYIVFEIPMYGGKPMFFKVFSKFRFNDMIKSIDSWT